jgi:hypothetical protein
MNEIETCKWLILTSDMPWEPNQIPFQELEDAAMANLDQVHEKDRNIYSMTGIVRDCLTEISDIYSDVRLNQAISVFALSTTNQQARVTSQKLAKRWSISESLASKTLKVTTQKGVRNALFPIEKRYRTRQAQLRYPQLSGRHGRFYTDTFFSNSPAIDMSKCCQLFSNDIGFNMVYPMRLKSETPNALKCFIRDVGIPQTIHSDNAKELMQGEWKKICNEFMITTTYTEPHSPWQNRAEGQIRELKRHVQRKMKSRNVPKRLWNYCVKWSCDVRNKTASNLFALEGRTPYEAIYGHTPDISSLCEFDFYEPVWYFDPHTFPEDNRLLGRWLGEAHQIGQAMCYWILTNTRKVIARSTVQAISEADINTEQVTSELKAFDSAIETRLSDSSEGHDSLDLPDYLQFVDEGLANEDIQTPHYEQVEPEAAMPEADDLDHDAYDKYIAAEVILPKGDTFLLGKVIGRKRDAEDNLIGTAHSNPIFDTRLYQVQFPEGQVEEYSANIIAQNLYSQLDSEGHRFVLLEDIIDYDKNEDAVPYENRFIVSNNGNIHKRRTTKGWSLCVMWKDGSTSWESLKDLKESFPIQVAEYAVSQGLQNEPAFSWWVKDTISRKNRIVKAMKTRYARKTHKFGVQLPKSIKEAYEIDRITGTDYWHRAIVKEMTNNAAAFKFLESDEEIPIGSTWIPCHMIFDVKMDLTRKARFVAGGHWTDPPSQVTYSSRFERQCTNSFLNRCIK